jgi:hypothetical protein
VKLSRSVDVSLTAKVTRSPVTVGPPTSSGASVSDSSRTSEPLTAPTAPSGHSEASTTTVTGSDALAFETSDCTVRVSVVPATEFSLRRRSASMAGSAAAAGVAIPASAASTTSAATEMRLRVRALMRVSGPVAVR